MWKNPDHWLSGDYLNPFTGENILSERVIDAYVFYYHSKVTEYVTYTNTLPSGEGLIEGLTNPDLGITITFSVEAFNSFLEESQLEDYLFSIDSNLFAHSTRMRIDIPPEITVLGSDCVEFFGSEIQPQQCFIDIANKHLWVYYEPSTDTILKIRTSNFAF